MSSPELYSGKDGTLYKIERYPDPIFLNYMDLSEDLLREIVDELDIVFDITLQQYTELVMYECIPNCSKCPGIYINLVIQHKDPVNVSDVKHGQNQGAARHPTVPAASNINHKTRTRSGDYNG
jgi:hypothetical protein